MTHKHDELLIRASDTDGWTPGAVPGLEEKVLWQAAPGDASIALLKFARGSGIATPHRHASNQFMYCLSGSYAYPRSELVLEPGSFYWNPVGNEHGPTEALADSLLLEIYDGQHYPEDGGDEIAAEYRIGTHLMHTNELVNVWDVTLRPGESIPWHIHRYPYVVVTVDAGQSEITDRDSGDVRHGDGAAGAVVYDPGGAHHTLKNVGDTLIRDRLIEFKAPKAMPRPPRMRIESP